jgi:AcrR family transcriptional regulator
MPAKPTGVRRSRLTAEQRRESIIEAAAAVFAEVGYQRGKTSEVAARVGVTEPVVFQNFGSKAALYAVVVERAARDLAQTISAVAHEDGGKVSVHLGHMLSPQHMIALHAPGSAGYLFADAMTLTAEPEIEQAARRGINVLAEAVTATLRKGQSDGDIRADLDPEAAAWWVLSLLASHRFRDVVMPPDPELHARMDELVLRTLTN